MTNYKKQLGITLKQAKEIAKQNNGRLPRPGYETCVIRGEKDFTYLDKLPNSPFYNRSITRKHNYSIYLANAAGKFYLWQHINVNSIP